MLKTDTKPCPKCKASIYKIDGCDQMWCTKCRTAFSWKTGSIEIKIHNPHYYEWTRANSNNNVATHCETDFNWTDADNFELLQTCNNDDCKKAGYHKECIQKYGFIWKMNKVILLRKYILPKYDIINVNTIMYRFIMKMNYLNKKISESEYKKIVENEECNKNRNIEIYQLIQIWIIAQSDILRRLNDSLKNDGINKCYNGYKKEFDELGQYVKNNIHVIETRYKTVLFDLSDYV